MCSRVRYRAQVPDNRKLLFTVTRYAMRLQAAYPQVDGQNGSMPVLPIMVELRIQNENERSTVLLLFFSRSAGSSCEETDPLNQAHNQIIHNI